MNKKFLKSVYFILSAIALSIIGNAFWELIIKPFIKKYPSLLINILTLGMQKSKDLIYSEIARNNHQSISIAIYFLVVFASYYFIFINIIDIWRGEYSSGKKINEDEITQQKLNRMQKKLKYLKLLTTLLFVSLYFFVAVSFFRSMYINSAITTYNQWQTIIKPYISENESKKISSSFALIKSESDYLNILKVISTIAKDNKIVLPLP